MIWKLYIYVAKYIFYNIWRKEINIYDNWIHLYLVKKNKFLIIYES